MKKTKKIDFEKTARQIVSAWIDNESIQLDAFRVIVEELENAYKLGKEETSQIVKNKQNNGVPGHYPADAGLCSCGVLCETGTGFRRHLENVLRKSSI